MKNLAPMINKLLIFIIVLCPIFNKIDAQQDVLERINSNLSLLIKDTSLLVHLGVSDTSVIIYKNEMDKINNKPEFVLNFTQIEHFLKHSRNQDQFLDIHNLMMLQNINSRNENNQILNDQKQKVKIAIDPGHFAHNFKVATYERRYIKAEFPRKLNKKRFFYEANLTHKTAEILKTKLEKEGFEVLLTREKNKSAFGVNYKQWFSKKKEEKLNKDYLFGQIDSAKLVSLQNAPINDKDLIKYFTIQELKERARIINEFNPDITVVIHYNVGRKLKENGFADLHQDNYCMAFIGGSYVKNELLTEKDRILFLRQLVSKDILKSKELSKSIIKAHQSICQIRTVNEKDSLTYLTKYSIETDHQGVYARNLFLTRNIYGPICYGESLLQDNYDEALELSKSYFLNKKSSNYRLLQVANAYFSGIVECLNNRASLVD